MKCEQHSLLSQLIENDVKLNSFKKTTEQINQGLAPILSQDNPSIELQKAFLLEQIKFQNWASKAKELCTLLGRYKIEFLLFKGFAYRYTLYQQYPLRPHSDIDVFVDSKNYKQVEEILFELNYNAVSSRQGLFVSFQNSFYDGNKINTVFDIHWQISNRTEVHRHFQFSKLHKQSIAISTPEFSFQTLNSIDAFIYGCFHFQAHRPNDRKHIWLYDLALLWKSLTAKEQEKCVEKSVEFELYDLVGGTLQILQSTFIGIINYETHNGKEFKSYNNYLKPRKNKLLDMWYRLIKIKGLKNKVAYLSEYLFQSTNYVQTRYKLKNSKWVYLFYPRMWFEDIIKLIKKP